MIALVRNVLGFVFLGMVAAGAAAQSTTATQAEPVVQEPGSTSLFLLIYREGPNWIPGQPMQRQRLRDHAAYIARLLEEGRLVAGGPFVDENGGMAIVRAVDLAEAEAILAADPALLNGTFVGEVKGWILRFDSGTPLTR